MAILTSEAALEASLCEQSIWALGNIAGNGREMRRKLFSLDVVRVLQNICGSISSLSSWTDGQKKGVLRNVMFLLSNLCREGGSFEDVAPAFDVFSEVIGRGIDLEMSIDALWGLSYLVSKDSGEEDKRCMALFLCGQKERSEIVVGENLLIQCLLEIVMWGERSGSVRDIGKVK